MAGPRPPRIACLGTVSNRTDWWRRQGYCGGDCRKVKPDARAPCLPAIGSWSGRPALSPLPEPSPRASAGPSPGDRGLAVLELRRLQRRMGPA